MKNIFKLLQLSSILLASVACNDQSVEGTMGDVDPQGEYATLTVGTPSTKVSYVYDPASGVATAWEEGDQISIFDNDTTKSHLSDFTLKELNDDGTATFVANSVDFDFVEGDTYNVVYSPDGAVATSYPESYGSFSTTQTASGDATHLKSAITLTGSFEYSSISSTVSLASEQCVEVVTLSSFGDVVPTALSFTCNGATSTVTLGYTPEGSAVVLIPANPNNSGAEATFEVTCSGGDDASLERTATLSQDHKAGSVYFYDIAMSVDESIEANSATATSGESSIILPLGVVISNAGDVGDYSISVDNGGAQSVSITSVSASDTNLVLALSAPIYSDDVVTLSYSGTSTLCNGGETILSTFSNLTVSAEATNLVGSDYLEMYSLEDGGVSNTSSNHKALLISTDDATVGSNSLCYSYDNSYANSTMASTATAAVAAYYVGINADPQPIPFTLGDYIIRFDCKIVEATASLTEAFYARIKTPSSQSVQYIDFGDYTIDSWYTVDVTMPLTTTLGYTDGTYAYSHVSFRTKNTGTALNESDKYVTPVDAEFFIDNIRVYNKSTLYRPTTD
ncbi:MAG: hypothetical protein SNH01_07565 [Rikenellaceae bacterium]